MMMVLRARGSLAALALGLALVRCGGDDEEAGVTPEDASTTNDGSVSDGGPNDGSDPDASKADGGTGLSPTYVHYDMNHVLGTGQSLSVGAVGSPVLSTTQPYANTMFSVGVRTSQNGLDASAALVEGAPITPENAAVETHSSAFANLVTKMAREELLVGQPAGKTSHDLFLSIHGVGGTAYAGLKKGTQPYAVGMAQVTAAKALAKTLGKSYVVRAVTNVHGESDHINQNAAYEANLAEWQADYEKDVKAITGQTEPIPMFHSQMSSWTKFGQATSPIPSMQTAATVKSGGKIVLIGPKYHLPYVADGVHLTNEGYRHMGEDYAKAYRRVVLEGRPWEPLRPLSITRVGAVITVKLAVPVPPIVLDKTLVVDPGSYGFAYVDAGPSTPAIASVEVTGSDTVTITLSAAPTATNRRLQYAFRAAAGASAGPATGPRGNLRDSDATASRYGYALYNWCIHFDELVP
jgi:hypothetical protein